MDIAVTPFNAQNIEKLSALGADTFIIGNEKFANRLVKSFSLLEISDITRVAKMLNKKIIISLNLIMHNDDIEQVSEFLDVIKKLDVDGIIFGDLGLYNIAKRKGLEHLLIYNPETLNTNFYDPIFWTKKGIKGLIISKEITLEDIKDISKDRTIEIGLIGHGHLNMFHSRRPLISNFFKYKEEEHKEYINNKNLKLVEELRNESYPVFQDEHGTHIFRAKSMESYKEVKELENHLNLFIIDGILKDSMYLEETLKNYQEILHSNNPQVAKKISESLQDTHDSGFLYKKTVYDKY